MSDQKIPRQLSAEKLAIHTRAIKKQFGKTTALSSLDLTVPENSFYLLVGSNGAGKSTTIRILLDLVRADSGVAEIFGIDTRRGGAVRAQIGWVSDRHDSEYTWLSGSQLLDFHSAYYPSWDSGYAARLVRSFDIDLSRKINRLSKGEARRIQLILAIAHRPSLLLLDEPTDGLDPAAREIVLGILAEHMSDTGCTVVASTHLVYEMDRLADHIGVIRKGSLVAQLSRDELDRSLRNYSLQVPAAWESAGAAAAGVTLVRKSERQREQQWMVWGNEEAVTDRLTASGASVQDVNTVSLEEAAIALMSNEWRDDS